jgi:hypothetical protein
MILSKHFRPTSDRSPSLAASGFFLSRRLFVKKGKKLLLLILLGALGAGTFHYFRDTTAPGIEASVESGPVSARSPLSVQLQDAGAGLKSLRVSLVQGEKAVEVVSRDFPPEPARRRRPSTLARRTCRKALSRFGLPPSTSHPSASARATRAKRFSPSITTTSRRRLAS